MSKIETHDISAHRRSSEDYKQDFGCDMYPPMDLKTAQIEAQRCYFCHDAPCIEACPTDIDIPSFIGKIFTGNLKGSAIDIYRENILGGSCARVCPTESLCEGACVRQTSEKKPVLIGQLQKFSTDQYMKNKFAHPIKRNVNTGKKVAIVGAGPAGLSCAHGLAKLGHEVEIFEARQKAGGLNEYGIAAYKIVDEFAHREVEFVTEIGGININYGQKLGEDISMEDLQKKYQAVFLAIGLAGVNSLGLENENLKGVIDAVDYIAELRQCKDLSKLAVGRNIVVIGGGSTAIDISIQTKRLGAENVTMVYRRGESNMGATSKEMDFAKKNGVLIKTWAKPKSISGDSHGVDSIEFEYTQSRDGKLVATGQTFTLKADMVFKAIGQKLAKDKSIAGIEISKSKFRVDKETLMTATKGVFAGGDCVFDLDLTVVAVRQGKLAAISIDKYLGGHSG